jgi:hypothetical protein
MDRSGTIAVSRGSLLQGTCHERQNPAAGRGAPETNLRIHVIGSLICTGIGHEELTKPGVF